MKKKTGQINLRRCFFIDDEVVFITSLLNAFEAERFDDVSNEEIIYFFFLIIDQI
jgi:hypothetical protein